MATENQMMDVMASKEITYLGKKTVVRGSKIIDLRI